MRFIIQAEGSITCVWEFLPKRVAGTVEGALHYLDTKDWIPVTIGDQEYHLPTDRILLVREVAE